jgi:transposase-like protein
MATKTKRYSSEFKFRVVLESYRENSVAEVARRYDVHANQVTMWRKQFQEQGPKIFESGRDKEAGKYRRQIEKLQSLVGKKEAEIDLLKGFVDFYSPPDGL